MSAEHCAWDADFAVACRMRMGWRRRRIGRPPRRWDAPMVVAWGQGVEETPREALGGPLGWSVRLCSF